MFNTSKILSLIKDGFLSPWRKMRRPWHPLDFLTELRTIYPICSLFLSCVNRGSKIIWSIISVIKLSLMSRTPICISTAHEFPEGNRVFSNTNWTPVQNSITLIKVKNFFLHFRSREVQIFTRRKGYFTTPYILTRQHCACLELFR